MTFEEFVNELHRPWYVWKMAHSLLRGIRPSYGYHKGMNGLVKGAPKRMEKAQQEIDDLVLKRAETIKQERIYAPRSGFEPR